MPRRRLIAAATAGALGLVVLTGCHSDPTVAAYVGGVKITEAQVDSIYKDAQAAFARNAQALKAQNPTVNPPAAPSRVDVVGVLVTGQLADRVIADKGIEVQRISSDQLASGAGYPSDAKFTVALANVVSDIGAIGQAVGGGYQPTDADLRSVYDGAVAAGILQPNSFEQSKPSLLQVDGLAQDLAARNELVKDSANERITVNPRYLPLAYPVETLNTQDGQQFVSVSLPLGTAGQPVTDVPDTSAPAPADQAGNPAQ